MIDNEREVDDKIEEQPQDNSVRGAIRAAIKETTEGDDATERPNQEEEKGREPRKEEGDEIARRLEKARQVKADKAASRAKGEVDRPTSGLDRKPRAQELVEKESDKSEKDGATPKVEEKAPASKIDPPPFWKAKAKDVWDQLTPAAQEAVIKREKEVSDGFAQYGQKSKAFDELARVIEPHLPAIQRHGVTVPQTIERLFGWMNALSHTNEDARAQAFKALAQSFNVNLARLGIAQTQTQENDQTNSNEPPPWFQQYAGQVNNELQSVKTAAQQLADQQRAQTANAAASIMQNWARDKPHYDQVRADMRYLIETGKVPLLENGDLDLDTAYSVAVSLHPEIQAQIRAESEAKAKADADEKAKKDAAEAAKRLERARRAGSSLRPAAPVIATPPSRGNGAQQPRQRKSVRESLIESIAQVSET